MGREKSWRLAWLLNDDSRLAELPESERDHLAHRLDDLDRAFAHRDKNNLRVAVASMFAMMKIAQADREGIDELITLYVARLSSLPTWAAVEACNQATKGHGSSEIFVPAASELYAAAERIVHLRWRERDRIAEALMRKIPPSPMEKKRLEEGFQHLSLSVAEHILNTS